MSDQIQRDDGEWQMLLNNAYSMVDSLTNRVEARDAQVESLRRENEELKRYVNEAERLFRMYGLSSPPRKGHEWPNTGGMGDE